MPLNKAGRKILKRLIRNYSSKGTRCVSDRYLYLNCPFHKERTASWCVDTKTGCHYCFGCHQHGNIWQIARKEPEILGRPKPREPSFLPFLVDTETGLPHDDDIPF